jgi:thiosulfate/3-mercaptopyruvate sulfurtransferase
MVARRVALVTSAVVISVLAIPASACGNSATTQPAANTTTGGQTYPNAALLVNGAWLKTKANDARLVIIDTRKDADYAAGHIQNAINIPPAALDVKNEAGDGSVLRTAAELSDVFGKNGVSNTSTVVLCGAANADYSSSRLFWALEYLGHKDAHILDGGYAKWTADGNATATEKAARAAVTFSPSANPKVIATKEHVKSNLGNANAVIVDSRNATDFVVKRIPGAMNILVQDYLNADGTMKSYADMKAFLDSKGITPGKTVIANCYVGYRSAQAYFVYRLMGFEVSNYDGSTTEWFADSSLPTEPK